MRTPSASATALSAVVFTSALAALVTLGPAALAQGNDEDDTSKDKGTVIEITSAVLGGSGCKPGKSKIFSYQSQGPKSPIDSFLVEHTNFAVGKLADKAKTNRALCNAALKVELPVHPDKTKGYQFGMTSMRHSGFMDVKEGVTATIKTTIGMRIPGAIELSSSQSTKGPFTGEFNQVVDKFFDKNGKEQPYWSVCGREPTFNVRTSVKLTGDSAARKESGMILDKVSNDEEADKRQAYAQDFRIHWRECTLPPPPDEDDSF